MKWMFRKSALWILMTIAAAAVAFAAGQEAQLPDGEGKKILDSVCTACHGLEGVLKLRLTKDEWKELVLTMIGHGAELKDEQTTVLVDYLTTNLGPKDADAAKDGAQPSGSEGKTILESSCTSCHSLDLVAGKELTKEEWEGIVASMKAMGAEVSDSQIAVLVEYLAKNFGPKNP